MKTVIWFIRAFFYLVGMIPNMLKAGKYYEQGDEAALRPIVDKTVDGWAHKMLENAGVTVEVHGKENIPSYPVLFVANHQSDWDIPIMLGYLDAPHGIVAKDDLAKIPLVRTWMKYLDCVFIDRNDARKALKAMNEAGSVIPLGRSISVFPEGTRSRCEEVGEFKNGAVKTAFKYNASIVPVAIDGTYKIMEGNKGNSIRPAHIVVTILPPVSTEGLDKTAQKELGTQLRQSIIDAREATRRAIAASNAGN